MELSGLVDDSNVMSKAKISFFGSPRAKNSMDAKRREDRVKDIKSKVTPAMVRDGFYQGDRYLNKLVAKGFNSP